MRVLSRAILVVALLLALVPLTAFADESSEYPTPMTPDQAMIMQAEAQIDAATTPKDIANATAIYELRMGAALGNAEAAIRDAQGMVATHPTDAGAKAQLAAAQNNYNQLLKICGIELAAPGVSPITMVESESLEPANGFTFVQGSGSQLPTLAP
jgi:hypothetical protein